MTDPSKVPPSDAADVSDGAEAPLLDRAARRKAKKVRRKAEKAAARAAARAAERGEAPPTDPAAPPEDTPAESAFAAFGLRPELLASVEAQGFEQPTPIQAAAIPPLLEGRDVVGQAQTGTGKTAAFALPILQRIDPSRRVVQAIVLVPTRELANQVSAAIATLARSLGGVAVLPVYGGQAIFTQLKGLKRGVHVVVGTPGRVMDHLRRESLSLADTTAVVIDEADEMLKMGFIEDVEWILEHAPGSEVRQTALFSATLPRPVRRVADRHLTDPVAIAIEPGTPAIATIDQRFIWAHEDRKLDTLCRLLEVEEGDAALVFTRTRAGSSRLADSLNAEGFAAEALHGDMNQTHRESVLRRLRSGDVRIVVATDVAARGLDVDAIALVVNYDAPSDAETYVHRIGRTGRAGRAGVSVLFLNPAQRRVLAGIQRYTGQRLTAVRPPTAQDVVDHRVGRFKAAVGRVIANADLDAYRRVAEEVAREGSHDMAVVAAAIAHLAADGRPLFAAPEPEPPPRPSQRPSADRRSPGPRGPRGPRADVVSLVLSVGSDAGVGPGDIVGAIANEAGVPGRAIGSIDIGDRKTFVEISAKHVRQVLTRVEGAKIRGRRTHIRPARSGEGGWRPPRRNPR